MRRRFAKTLLPVLAALLPATAGIAQNPDSSINVYSLEKEIALGKSLATEIEQRSEILADPVVAGYVDRLGQNLVRHSNVKFPVTIKVIGSQQATAAALPGGFLFVSSGLIIRAETEAELAGIMAHQIAHIAALHGTRQAGRVQAAHLATVPLIFWGGWGGICTRLAAGAGIPVGFLSVARSFEEEADLLALQYLYKAGYDPSALFTIFEKLSSGRQTKPQPLADDRVKELLQARPEYVVTTSMFQDVKARLAAAPNRKNGAAHPSLERRN